MNAKQVAKTAAAELVKQADPIVSSLGSISKLLQNPSISATRLGAGASWRHFGGRPSQARNRIIGDRPAGLSRRYDPEGGSPERAKPVKSLKDLPPVNPGHVPESIMRSFFTTDWVAKEPISTLGVGG